ncbi:hypothetical protein EVA_13802 [gut metagenome]|uniref:Uncharacterized protein n=1 Tax=gut metagenome TaxID=749906 RepID=J9FT25_9ZZZZ
MAFGRRTARSILPRKALAPLQLTGSASELVSVSTLQTGLLRLVASSPLTRHALMPPTH